MNRDSWTARVEAARTLVARMRGTGELVDAAELLDMLEELEVIGEELADKRNEQMDAVLATVAERERYRSLFEFDPSAQILTTIAGLALNANRRARSLLHLSDEPRGHLSSLLPLEATPMVNRAVSVLRRHPAPFRASMDLGADRSLLVRVDREQSDGGELLRWFFYEPDDPAGATQQAIEEQIEALNQSRQDHSSHVELMLASIGHDLRNPIQAMLGLTELLMDDRILSKPHQREQLRERILASAQTIKEMLDVLLARAQQGPFADTTMRTIRLPTVVRDTMSTVAQLTHPVFVEIPAGATVQADPVMTRGIITNALLNAVEHTPPGTRIWIKAWYEQAGVALCIEDDGPGIPARSRARMLSPGFRPQTEGGRRPGLGLSLIAGFASAMGGTASVEDRPGGGTRIRVLFPAAATEAAHPTVGASVTELPPRGKAPGRARDALNS